MNRYSSPRILGVILARGGSKGVPRKNVRPVLGHPLLAYTICEALRSTRITRLIVSSDDDEIRAVARRYGAEAPFRRPAELAADHVTSAPALQHAVAWAEADEGRLYDYIIELMVTNPLKTVEDIDAVLDKLITTGAESVIGMSKLEDHHPARIKKIIDDRIVDFCVPETSGLRQELKPEAFIRNGSIYAMRRDVLMEQGQRYGTLDSRPYIMPPARTVNVDSEADLFVAEYYLQQRDLSHVRPRHSVSLLMGAWHGARAAHLDVHPGWQIQTCGMADAPSIDDAAIIAALRTPIQGPRLSELAHTKLASQGDKARVCIAIDDLERPTEAWRIVPTLLDELNMGGVSDEQVYVIVSLGTHRPLNREDLVKKLGEQTLERVRVYNHSAYQNLVTLGETSYGTPVEINRDYAEAHLKIAVGMLSPHAFAGYSGGGKIIMPGLAGFNTVLRNHKPVVQGLSGRTGQVAGNTRRAEIEEAARIAGLDWLVNCVANSRAETSAVFAGEPEAVYLAAARLAQRTYCTDVVYQNDIAIFNAFPKDTELIQALNSLNVWTSQKPERLIVKPGGTVVFVTASTHGVGTHGLFGPGGALFVRRDKHGLFAEILNGRDAAFYSPNLYPPNLIGIYPPSVMLFREWGPLLDWLVSKHGTDARVAVFPTGPLQIAREDIEALAEAGQS